ncbi:hypothetical protein [Saliniramus sp.]|uniref:hypothetical protein n=1 Tax=Saliniramus sp. TaxID=2986772 RepID=UPI002B8EB8BD|nr:hypothetical protein [Saliniramus sp.]HMB11510.1 hypothetical protein [Saliniramus sp.]
MAGLSDAFGEVVNRFVNRVLPEEDRDTIPKTFQERMGFAFAGGLFITLIIVFGYGHGFAPVGSPAAATGVVPLFVGAQSYAGLFRSESDSIILYAFIVIILTALIVYSYVIARSLTRRGPLTLLIAGSALPILMLSLGKIALS